MNINRPSLSCRIIEANRGEQLIDQLTTLCDEAETLSLAIGFLFLDGIAPLLPRFQKLRKVQLLIGNVVNRLTEEQLHEAQLIRGVNAADGPEEMFAKGLREERNRIAMETTLNLRRTIDAMARTKANRSLIIDFATLIAKGTIQVRLLTSRRLHAKAALLTYPEWHPRAPAAAIIGSSNVSFSSRYASQSQQADWSADLDITIEGRENTAYLTDWFGAHWVEAQDIQKELFEELGQSWPLLAETDYL